MFGLGFVHAQDRLWQLETHRASAPAGWPRPSAKRALETDSFLRALGVRRAAAAQWAQRQRRVARGRCRPTPPASTPIVRDAAARAAAGVPASSACSPSRGTPVDSLAWAIMMAWDLGGNWSTELLRMRLALQAAGRSASTSCCRRTPATSRCRAPTTRRCFASLKRRRRHARPARRCCRRPSRASKASARTTGCVAGIAHRHRQAAAGQRPAPEADARRRCGTSRALEAPGFKVAGATMPGLPVVVLGQNEHVAWGFTNTGPDVQDLYLERIEPDDPTQLPDARRLGARSRPSTR